MLPLLSGGNILCFKSTLVDYQKRNYMLRDNLKHSTKKIKTTTDVEQIWEYEIHWIERVDKI